MFARVVTLPMDPVDLPGIEARFRDVSAPLLASLPGFSGLIACTQRESGYAMSTSLWADRATLAGSSLHPHVVDEVTRFASITTGPFNRDELEVLLQRSATPPAYPLGDDLAVIVTHLSVVDEAWDELVAHVPSSSPTVDPDGTGRLLVQVLGSRERLRLQVTEVWSSPEGPLRTGTFAYDDPMMFRRRELFSSVQVLTDMRMRAWLPAPDATSPPADILRGCG